VSRDRMPMTELPGQTVMDLNSPLTKNSAAGQTLPPDMMMMQKQLYGNPFEMDDQGRTTIGTPEEALRMEGMRRLSSGETPQPQGGGPPPLDPNMFPGLEEFLAPGGG